jgi:hypothetical protein
VFLVDRPDPRGLGQADFVVAGVQLAQDQLEQGGLAHAVATDQADLGAGGKADTGMVKELPTPGVEGQVTDLKHFVKVTRRGWRGGGARL